MEEMVAPANGMVKLAATAAPVWAGAITVPTLITVGDHDECDPALSTVMHDKIAGSQLVVLPKSGHMTFVDQPRMFIEAVGSFLHR